MIRQLALAAAAALTLVSCASNPATGGHNVVLSSTKGEIEQSRRLYEQIIRAYGLYEDQAVQDYVNSVGQKVAKHSDLPTWTFHFTVLDDEYTSSQDGTLHFRYLIEISGGLLQVGTSLPEHVAQVS